MTTITPFDSGVIDGLSRESWAKGRDILGSYDEFIIEALEFICADEEDSTSIVQRKEQCLWSNGVNNPL